MKIKNRKMIVRILTLILLVISFSNNVLAYEDNYKSKGYDYIIKLYEIGMKVNVDNTFDITEKITVDYVTPRHGIVRKIPLKNDVKRLDGTRTTNIARVSDIIVTEEFFQKTENNNMVLKIGNPNQEVTGTRDYTIKYKYDIGKDPLKGEDELYFNIIGNQWDTKIKKVKFKIEMPKEFDEKFLGFSSGKESEIGSENIIYRVEGKTIKGETFSTLNPSEGINVRLKLPEGYFERNSSILDIYTIIINTIFIIMVIIAFIMWYKYGKDYEKVETVEFYPPDGYNPAEINFLYNGEVDEKGVLSLLVYLANKGYIEIEEIKGDGILDSAGTFKIKKKKEYDGKNKYEKMFLKGLFKKEKTNEVDIEKANEIVREAKKHGENISFIDALTMTEGNYTENQDVVTEEDLKENFYDTIAKIQDSMNTSTNENKVIDPVSRRKKKWIALMGYLIFILIYTVPILTSQTGKELLVMLIFPLIGFTVLIGSLINEIRLEKGFAILWGGLFGGIPWIAILNVSIIGNPSYVITNIIGFIAIFILIILFKIMPKRTKKAIKLKGRIEGFKNFLETAEKPQLEAMVLKEPEYFYDILPYTYALGISDKWFERFETILVKNPNWYRGEGDFNVTKFDYFMDTSSKAINYSNISSGSSYSGGSSGGGSGGGGGSSW